MAWRPLFKPDVDVEAIKRQLVPCLSAIVQHAAVTKDFEDFHGRLVGPTSTKHAQQLLDFIGDRMWSNGFTNRIQQALNRKELKPILRNYSMALSGSVNQEQQIRERREIADWLSPLNFKAYQIDHLLKRHGDSGKWFLEHQKFKNWRDGGPGMLWCHGSPGVGKTVLAAITIDHLQMVYMAHNVSITWIYCNYKEKAEQTICHLVGSLLRQIVENRHSISKDIKELYDRHQSDNTRPALDELEWVAEMEYMGYSKSFVVVDAINESGEAQADLLQFLEKLSGLANVIVTSRDGPMIKNWFGPMKRIEIQAGDDDIRKYIQGRIRRSKLQHLKRLESEIVDRVIKRAQGMFLLVQLLMDSIVAKRNHMDIHEALEKMPKGIDDIYADALEQIHKQDGDKGRLGEQVLKWITFALRPLSVEELQEALAVGQGLSSLNPEAVVDEDILASVCAGLVTVDKEETGIWGKYHHVRLIHYTAQDYFDRTRTLHFPGAHTDIAKTCIMYLSQDALLGIQAPTYTAMKDLMRHHHLLDYASNSWGNHVMEQSDEDCNKMVLDFLEDEKKFLLSGQILFGSEGWMAVGFNGIHLSSFFGLEYIVGEQLLKGADPTQTDNDGRTPLAYAAMGGHEKVVKMLLAQPNNVMGKNGSKPLLIAAIEGHIKVVKILLGQSNVDINFADKHGETPLIGAARNGHIKVVELLLGQPTLDINQADKDGQTPLLKAAANGHEKVLELLFQEPIVDINQTDKDGQTPLLKAAANGHEKVVELLLGEPTVDINQADKDGHTPLLKAAANGHEKVVELMLGEPTININQTDKYGQTPLLWAAANGHEKVVELLLGQPTVDINQIDEDGQTPLLRAVANGHEEVVELLLGQPTVNINQTDSYGQTSLLRAAANRFEKVVEALALLPSRNLDLTNHGLKTVESVKGDLGSPSSMIFSPNWGDVVSGSANVRSTDLLLSSHKPVLPYKPIEQSMYPSKLSLSLPSSPQCRKVSQSFPSSPSLQIDCVIQDVPESSWRCANGNVTARVLLATDAFQHVSKQWKNIVRILQRGGVFEEDFSVMVGFLENAVIPTEAIFLYCRRPMSLDDSQSLCDVFSPFPYTITRVPSRNHTPGSVEAEGQRGNGGMQVSDDPSTGTSGNTGNGSPNMHMQNDEVTPAVQGLRPNGNGVDDCQNDESLSENGRTADITTALGGGDGPPGGVSETTMRNGWFVSEVHCYRAEETGWFRFLSRTAGEKTRSHILTTRVKLDRKIEGSYVSPSISCLDISFQDEAGHGPHIFLNNFRITMNPGKGKFYPYLLSPGTSPVADYNGRKIIRADEYSSKLQASPKPLFEVGLKRTNQSEIVYRNIEYSNHKSLSSDPISVNWTYVVKDEHWQRSGLYLERAKPPGKDILPYVTFGPQSKAGSAPQSTSLTVACFYDTKYSHELFSIGRPNISWKNFIHKMDIKLQTSYDVDEPVILDPLDMPTDKWHTESICAGGESNLRGLNITASVSKQTTPFSNKRSPENITRGNGAVSHAPNESRE